MGGMTIGALSRKSGVGVESIRFYERRGLITQQMRGALMRLVNSCSGRGLISACPILDSLEKLMVAKDAPTGHRKPSKGRTA